MNANLIAAGIAAGFILVIEWAGDLYHLLVRSGLIGIVLMFAAMLVACILVAIPLVLTKMNPLRRNEK